jgi:hypothetical protein
MIEFEWKFVSIALVCVLAASFVAVAPYAAAQVTITSNSLFVGDKTTNSPPEYVKLVDVQTGATSVVATDGINGPNGIIFNSGVMLVANQFPNTNMHGDIAKYNPSTGQFLGPLVPQSDPNAPHAPRGIVLSPDHKFLYVADFTESIGGGSSGPGKLLEYDATSGAFIASYSAQTLLNSQFKDHFNPRGLVFGSNGLLYISVVDTSNPLTGYILTFSPATHAFNILVRSDAANNYDGLGVGAGMHRPEGLVFDSSGNLWVTSFCDTKLACPSSTNVDKIMEFDSSGNFITHNTVCLSLCLESSTDVSRTYAQAILFGPNLGATNENLYVPITATGQLRVYETQTTPFTFTSVVQSGSSPLVQPWYLSFGGTDPSTLAYTTAVSALSSSPSSLSSTQAPSNTQPIPSQPNFRPFQP